MSQTRATGQYGSNIEELYDQIRGCNLPDRHFRNMMSFNGQMIQFSIWRMEFAPEQGGMRCGPSSRFECPGTAELFIVLINKGWLQSALFVGQHSRIDWNEYALTNAILSNMSTPKKINRDEFEKLIMSLEDPSAKVNDAYETLILRLLDQMSKIQTEVNCDSSYDINMKDKKGRSPLFRECQGHFPRLDQIISTWHTLGADMHTIDRLENTLIHALVYSGRLCHYILTELHCSHPHMIFKQNIHGNTPLHLAVMRGHSGVVWSFIKNFLYQAEDSHQYPRNVHELKTYIDTKNRYNRSAIEMIMQPKFFKDCFRETVEFDDIIRCAGIMIFYDATISRGVGLWLETIAKRAPKDRFLQLVASRVFTRKIDNPSSIDTQNHIQELVTREKFEFMGRLGCHTFDYSI